MGLAGKIGFFQIENWGKVFLIKRANTCEVNFTHEKELMYVFDILRDEIGKVIKSCPRDLLDHNHKDLWINAIKDGNS